MKLSAKNQDRSEVDSIWAAALLAATGVARRAGSSEAEVLRAVTEELRRLHLRGGVVLLTPDGQLEVRNRFLSPAVETSLRRLLGLDLAGYRFDPAGVELYREILEKARPVFTPNRSRVVGQILPPALRILLPRVMALLGDHPVIAAPLLIGDKVIGAISVSAPWLTERDTEMVGALADHIAIALGQVRTNAEMKAALERERLRNQAAETIASALDLQTVLERIIRLAAGVTGAEAGSMALLEPDGQALGFSYLFNLPETLRRQPAPRGQGLAWELLRERRPIVLEDYGSHPQALPEWVRAGVHSFLGVPLMAGDEPIGAMGLFHLRPGVTFRPEQVASLEALAHMAAIAVKNARLYSEATRRAEESQALIRTARSISASLDLSTVLHLIAREAKDLLRADGSRIQLLDASEDTLRCLVAIDPHAEAVLGLELKPGVGLVGHVMETGEPLLTNDPASHPRALQIPGTPEDEQESLILAPLKIRQRTMGVMTVRRIGRDRPFQTSDLDLLSALAAQAAIGIENAHLYGQIESQAQRLEVVVVARTHDLALSEARYRALVETSLAGIIQTDPTGHLVYANRALATLLDRSELDLIGRPFSDCLAPDFRPEEERRFRARLRGDRPAREVYEVALQTSSERRIPVLLAVSLIVDDAGSPQGISALVFDISIRKGLEAELQSERDRLHTILANVGDAVVVTDSESLIQYVNPAWERLTGYDSAEAIGQTPRLLRSEVQPRLAFTQMWQTLREGKTWHGELVNRRKDGSTYDAAVTITPVLHETGAPINFVAVQYDISALKQLDRLKSQFVSDVSHELRTPLTNIRLYLDLLAETDDRERSQRYLQTLTRESERLADLIEDLLSLSRLESGVAPLEVGPVDVNELLRALVEDRHRMATQRGLHLSLECAPRLPPAAGDARLLAQIFTNLLTNALNYSESGGRITLTTEIEGESEGDRWIVAHVEDTGLGVAPEEIPMIFRRFYRGRASHLAPNAGTGLGLSICKEIAERHGGRIMVSSEGIQGRGSRFTVWLPAAMSEAVVPPAPARPAESARA
ncbi:MAG: GAF domain-containing protein [Anaerolineales bacterium]